MGKKKKRRTAWAFSFGVYFPPAVERLCGLGLPTCTSSRTAWALNFGVGRFRLPGLRLHGGGGRGGWYTIGEGGGEGAQNAQHATTYKLHMLHHVLTY